jgi:hypothetical protein
VVCGVGGGGMISPFTAITLQVTSNNVSVTLPNAYRNYSMSTNFFDKTGMLDNYVSLKVKNLETEVTDVARFYTNDAALSTFDIYDANKKMNDPKAPSLYFVSNGRKLYKEVWPGISEKGVDLPVSFSTQATGAYQITAELENIEAGLEVYLEDLLSRKLYDITKGAINFDMNTGDVAERFVLHIRKKSINTGVAELNTAAYFIGSNGTNVSIGSTQAETLKVEVMDLLGQTLSQTVVETQTGQTAVLPALQVATGYYLVKVTGQSGTQVSKVYLK